MTSRRQNTASCVRVEGPRRARPSAWSWALAFALVTLVGLPAVAHVGHTSYCSAQSVAGGLELKLDAPPLLTSRTSDPARDVESHVRATTPRGECALTVNAVGPAELVGSTRFELAFTCPDGPITLGCDYGMDVDSTSEVVCAIDGHAHVFRHGALDYVVGTPPTFGSQLASFVVLGGLHVATGLDHVLFVLLLLLGAVAGVSHASGRALRGIVGVVTGFTLGHSVTLLLAALGIWRLPPALTESLIALSIILVAVHNLVAQQPRGRALTSAAFGLVHGFGFASALAEVGLPRRGTVVTLLAFNVGIELAQLLLVFACFPGLVWASRRPWFRARVLLPCCAAIAGLAAVWFVKRAFGVSSLPWLGS